MSAYGLNTVVRKDSKSQMLGVSYERVRCGRGILLNHYSIRAYYRQNTKKFSIKKFGLTKAVRLAELWRETQRLTDGL